MNADRPNSGKVWWLAARPKTLPAAATPVLVGCACSFTLGTLLVLPAIATLLGALLLQIASNFANDVFDYEKGADTEERQGPIRAVAAGWLTPRQMKLGLGVVLGLALIVGAYLVWVAGPWLVAVGLLSMLAAVAYTGGPYPLGYNGLGDISVLIFFGLVAVAGTVFVQSGEIPALAMWASLPIGCLATNILVVNNVRDFETDRHAGKRTLVVRFGQNFGQWEYRLLAGTAYGAPLVLWAVGALNVSAILPILTAPFAIGLAKKLNDLRGSELNAVLASTAKLLFLFGVLFSLALVLSA